MKQRYLRVFVLWACVGWVASVSVSGASDSVDSITKNFGYFEDSLGLYCEFDRIDVTEEIIQDAGQSLFERRREIIRFVQKDAKEIKLEELVDVDMYPLARGILERALKRDLCRLERINLTESEKLTAEAFSTLFTALVNRGICDEWAKGEDGENYLHNLRIVFPTMELDSVFRHSQEIASRYRVFFEIASKAAGEER
ncbi:MAG: hypothetical protein Q8Q56_00435 [Alphaproteobacteria bacterium]|nr:hypothetical protein [Alphaproteobacteria bacterium]